MEKPEEILARRLKEMSEERDRIVKETFTDLFLFLPFIALFNSS